jgi:23S rRNA-/tRNA-specific pseudouridylate synthase
MFRTSIRRALQIIHHDREVIAINKPVGMLSQPDKTEVASVYDQTKKLIKEMYPSHGTTATTNLHL